MTRLKAGGDPPGRIIGPDFAVVLEWIRDDVPLSVVERAIDETAARPRGRGQPVRIRVAYLDRDVRRIADGYRRRRGPDYGRLRAAGMEEAETAEWCDCSDCGSPALADMQRCPRCGSANLKPRGTGGDIRYDDREVQRAMNRLLRASKDLSPAMREIAGHLADSAEGSLESQAGPDGTPWKPSRTTPSPIAGGTATASAASSSAPAISLDPSRPTTTRRAPSPARTSSTPHCSSSGRSPACRRARLRSRPGRSWGSPRTTGR